MVATGSACHGMIDPGFSPYSGQSHQLHPNPHTLSGTSFSPIARRLALWIAAVALVALGLFATATWISVSNDVSTLTSQQEHDLGTAVTQSLALRYRQSGSWDKANLKDPLTLAKQAGLAVEVRGNHGALITQVVPAGEHPGTLGPALVLSVVANGNRVGTVTVRTGTTGFGAAAASLRSALASALWWSAIVASVLAIVAGIVVARRITRPVLALTAASRAMASGNRSARVGNVQAEGELAELSGAFDQMAETLEREAELRRLLVADVAHELRTPLAILQATSEAMADGVTEPNASTLASLHDETLRLGRIVQDLEVLASAEAAGLNLELKPVDLAAVASEVAMTLRPRAHEAGLQLAENVESVIVRGDEVRLHQIFANLLTNSIKFTAAGGIIRVRVLGKGEVAWASVEDSGVGISREDSSHIFERFWRGPGSGRIEGSGIGLAVVRELVLAHGGEVTVKSEVGHGSCFVVTLPRI